MDDHTRGLVEDMNRHPAEAGRALNNVSFWTKRLLREYNGHVPWETLACWFSQIDGSRRYILVPTPRHGHESVPSSEPVWTRALLAHLMDDCARDGLDDDAWERWTVRMCMGLYGMVPQPFEQYIHPLPRFNPFAP